MTDEMENEKSLKHKDEKKQDLQREFLKLS